MAVANALLEPILKRFNCRGIIRSVDRFGEIVRGRFPFHGKKWIGQTDSLEAAAQNPAHRAAYLEQSHFDARRTAIDGEDVLCPGSHAEFSGRMKSWFGGGSKPANHGKDSDRENPYGGKSF